MREVEVHAFGGTCLRRLEGRGQVSMTLWCQRKPHHAAQSHPMIKRIAPCHTVPLNIPPPPHTHPPPPLPPRFGRDQLRQFKPRKLGLVWIDTIQVGREHAGARRAGRWNGNGWTGGGGPRAGCHHTEVILILRTISSNTEI